MYSDIEDDETNPNEDYTSCPSPYSISETYYEPEHIEPLEGM